MTSFNSFIWGLEIKWSESAAESGNTNRRLVCPSGVFQHQLASSQDGRFVDGRRCWEWRLRNALNPPDAREEKLQNRRIKYWLAQDRRSLVSHFLALCSERGAPRRCGFTNCRWLNVCRCPLKQDRSDTERLRTWAEAWLLWLGVNEVMPCCPDPPARPARRCEAASTDATDRLQQYWELLTFTKSRRLFACELLFW